MSAVSDQIAVINQNISNLNSQTSNVLTTVQNVKSSNDAQNASINNLNNLSISLLASVNRQIYNFDFLPKENIYPRNFSYNLIGQSLKTVVSSVSDTDRKFVVDGLLGLLKDTSGNPFSFGMPIAGDYIANILKNKLSTLTAPAGFTYRLSLIRSDGSLLYDTYEESQGRRISNLTDNKNYLTATPTKVTLTDSSGSIVNLLAIVTNRFNINNSPKAIQTSLFGENLNLNKEVMAAQVLGGCSFSWRIAQDTGKTNYYVACMLNNESYNDPLNVLGNNSNGSQWVVRLSCQQV